MPKPAAISLEEFASKAEVHKSTIVRALKNHPRISKGTCERIQKLAEKWNYAPNPLASRMMSEVKRGRPLERAETIAMWNPNPTSAAQDKQYPESVEIFEGARKQAEKMGYRFEEVLNDDCKMTGKRLAQILKSRGIEGLLLFIPRSESTIEIDISAFSAVSVTHHPTHAHTHRILHDSQHAIDLAYRKLIERGIRRIGVCLPSCVDSMAVLRFSIQGVCNDYSQRGLTADIPFFYCDAGGKVDQWINADAFEKWFRKHKPEVIIGESTSFPKNLSKHLCISIPRDLQYVCFAKHGNSGHSKIAGVKSPNFEIGATAIKHIVSMIQNGERGTPTFPGTYLIPGQWQDGTSLS